MKQSTKNVKKALIDSDMNISELAELISYTRVHLSNVIHCKQSKYSSLRARKIIAIALKKDFNELWVD